MTGDPQILQLQKKPREVSENVQGDPSGTSGGGMNPVPVLQQQLDAPRAQESRPTGDADGSRGRKGRLHGARDEPKQALHAARRMAGAKKLLVVGNFRAIPGRPPKFGAKIHHFRSNPELVDRYTSFGDQDSELATGWTIAEDGTLLRVAPSSCTIFLQQSTGPVYKAA